MHVLLYLLILVICKSRILFYDSQIPILFLLQLKLSYIFPHFELTSSRIGQNAHQILSS